MDRRSFDKRSACKGIHDQRLSTESHVSNRIFTHSPLTSCAAHAYKRAL